MKNPRLKMTFTNFLVTQVWVAVLMPSLLQVLHKSTASSDTLVGKSKCFAASHIVVNTHTQKTLKGEWSHFIAASAGAATFKCYNASLLQHCELARWHTKIPKVSHRSIPELFALGKTTKGSFLNTCLTFMAFFNKCPGRTTMIFIDSVDEARKV